MTREELRRAFRQAQPEEFAAVPLLPVLHASPQFHKKMERMLGLVPRRISKSKRIAVILLVAVLLISGGCAVYQVVNASIRYTGETTVLNQEPTYHYLVADSQLSENPDQIPHYQFPDPEGFVHLCSNDVGQDHQYPVACVDQWYNQDTQEVLTLIQQRHYTGLEFETSLPLESTQLEDVTVYYSCGAEEAYAFWLYDESAIQLVYWGSVSEEQLLDWIKQMDYTNTTPKPNLNAGSEYDCCIPLNSYDLSRPQALEFRYYMKREGYDQMADTFAGRDTRVDYHFESVPEGFTLIQRDNEYSPTQENPALRIYGATDTYENARGDRLVLEQTILMPLGDNTVHWDMPISNSRPGEEVQVLDMDGIYFPQEGRSRLVWRYGGRRMELTYDGDISKEDLIALAETVDYSEP